MILFKIKSYIMPSKNVTGNMMLPVKLTKITNHAKKFF